MKTIILNGWTISLEEGLQLVPHIEKPSYLITDQAAQKVHLILSIHSKGLTIHSRWQVSCVLKEKNLTIYTDLTGPSSIFAEDEPIDNSKRTQVYRLGFKEKK